MTPAAAADEMTAGSDGVATSNDDSIRTMEAQEDATVTSTSPTAADSSFNNTDNTNNTNTSFYHTLTLMKETLERTLEQQPGSIQFSRAAETFHQALCCYLRSDPSCVLNDGVSAWQQHDSTIATPPSQMILQQHVVPNNNDNAEDIMADGRSVRLDPTTHMEASSSVASIPPHQKASYSIASVPPHQKASVATLESTTDAITEETSISSSSLPANQRCKDGWWSSHIVVRMIHRPIRVILRRMAIASAMRPKQTIFFFSILAILMVTVGLHTNWNVNVDDQQLWTPIHTISNQHSQWIFDKTQSGLPGGKRWIVVLFHDDGANIVTFQRMAKVFNVLDILHETTNMTMACGDSVPFSGLSSSGCSIYGPTSFWRNSRASFAETVANDEDVREIMSALILPEGVPVVDSQIFGNLERDNQRRIASAQSMVLTMTFLHTDDSVAWEKEVSNVILRIREEWAAQYPFETDGLQIEMQAKGSMGSEFKRAIANDIPLVPIVFVTMAVFTALVFSRWNSIQSRSLLGIGAVVAVLLSISSGFGLLFIIGVPFTSITQILPFIIFGVGLDDAFVLFSSYGRTDPKRDSVERICDTIDDVGALSLTQAFEITDVLPNDSFVTEFLVKGEEYRGVGPLTTGIYFRDCDHSDPATRAQMQKYIDELLQTDYFYEPPDYFWLRHFNIFAASQTIAELPFPQQMNLFLNHSVYGELFGNDISRDGAGNVIVSRTFMRMNVDLSDVRDQVAALQAQRQVSENQEINRGRDRFAFFTYEGSYKMTEFFTIAIHELIFTTISGVVAVTVTAMLFIPHWSAILFVFPLISILYIDLLGVMQWAGLHVNAVSYVSLAMSIGVLVDFLMHILFRYYESSGNRVERTIELLRTMGSSILLGATSTFLGTIPLMFCSSDIFETVFYCFLGIVTLGAGHGLILLPVLLATFGPEAPLPNRREYSSLKRFRSRSKGFRSDTILLNHAAMHHAAATVKQASQNSSPIIYIDPATGMIYL